MVPLSVVKTFLVTAFVQSIFYGVYVITLIHSLRWLLFRAEGWKAQSTFDRRTLGVTLLIFVFSTVDLGITFHVTFAVVTGKSPVQVLEILSVRIPE